MLAAYRAYVKLALADELDDVDCSGSTLASRDAGLRGAAAVLGPACVERAERFVARVMATKTHDASGRPI